MILQRLIDLYHWILSHPGESVFGTLFGLAALFVLGMIGLGIWDAWCYHEEQKARERELADIRRSRSLAAAHRLPRPFSEKASQGFTRRVS